MQQFQHAGSLTGHTAASFPWRNLMNLLTLVSGACLGVLPSKALVGREAFIVSQKYAVMENKTIFLPCVNWENVLFTPPS